MTEPLSALRDVLVARGLHGWLVGGAVRDRLLGRAAADADVVVPRDAVAVGRAVAAATRGAFVPLAPERGIVRVVWPADRPAVGGGPDIVLDITEFVGGSLAADLAARDFTVNALAIPLEVVADRSAGTPRPAAVRRAAPAASAAATALLRAAVVDVVGGLADLDTRRVRMVNAAAFDADPLRLLRGPRLAAELGFDLDAATSAAIAARAPALHRPARERVRDEFARLLAVDDAAAWIGRIEALGLLAGVLPEVAACRGVGAAEHDVLDHTVAVVDGACRLTRRLAGQPDASVAAPADAVVDARRAALAAWFAARLGGRAWAVWWRLAALLHDVGKPATAARDASTGRWRFIGHDAAGAELAADAVRRLRLGTDEGDRVVAVVRHHLRPLALADHRPVRRRAIFRYFDAAGVAGVDVALHALVDRAAKPEPGRADLAAVAATAADLLAAWFDAPAVAVSPPPLLRGDDVIARFGIPPGPRLGALLAGLREAQAAGDVGTIDDALAWVADAIAAE